MFTKAFLCNFIWSNFLLCVTCHPMESVFCSQRTIGCNNLEYSIQCHLISAAHRTCTSRSIVSFDHCNACVLGHMLFCSFRASLFRLPHTFRPCSRFTCCPGPPSGALPHLFSRLFVARLSHRLRCISNAPPNQRQARLPGPLAFSHASMRHVISVPLRLPLSPVLHDFSVFGRVTSFGFLPLRLTASPSGPSLQVS